MKSEESNSSLVKENLALKEHVKYLTSHSVELYSEHRDKNTVDLGQVWDSLWAGKLVIIAASMISVIVAIIIALSLPNEYKSEVLLSPVSDPQGGGALSQLAGKFGGLASLAGINIGGGADKTTLAMETLQSRSFINEFVENHNLLIPLMAAEEWNLSEDKLIIDPEIYDIESSSWVRDVKPPKTIVPTGMEIHEAFLERLTVKKNDFTGYINLSFEFYSPYLAKEWLEWLVRDLNHKIRDQDIEEANKTIVYLNEQLEITNVSEMRKVFYELIESQTQTVMLANVRDEYVFKTIDSAMLADEKSQPARSIIVILAGLFGGIVGCIIVLFRQSKRQQQEV